MYRPGLEERKSSKHDRVLLPARALTAASISKVRWMTFSYYLWTQWGGLVGCREATQSEAAPALSTDNSAGWQRERPATGLQAGQLLQHLPRAGLPLGGS